MKILSCEDVVPEDADLLKFGLALNEFCKKCMVYVTIQALSSGPPALKCGT